MAFGLAVAVKLLPIVAGLAVLVGLVTAVWMRSEKKDHGMVCERICLANGSIDFLCTGCVPVVFALAAAAGAFSRDAADHHLDKQYYPYLSCLAATHPWTVRRCFLAGLCCWSTDAWP